MNHSAWQNEFILYLELRFLFVNVIYRNAQTVFRIKRQKTNVHLEDADCLRETGSPSQFLDNLKFLRATLSLHQIRLSRPSGFSMVIHARRPVQLDPLSREEPVDLLQGQIPGLGIAEIDEREEAEVEDAEIDVRAPSDIPDADGRDLHHEEGEDPVRRCRKCGSACPDGKRRILGRHLHSTSVMSYPT